MDKSLLQVIPQHGTQIVLVLFLSFLIGLQREEQKARAEPFLFGGVRTFPLLGMLALSLSLLTPGDIRLCAVGLVVVGALLWQSYRHKVETAAAAGMTTELSGLLTYVVGALVASEDYWVAVTLTVISVGLLELKVTLESLARRIPSDEILTFSKFLLLAAVILPVVPDQTYGVFGFNPFKTWLVVVAVSAISYGSYLLQLSTRARGSVLIAAVLGGAYSSTLTTIVLARRAHEQGHTHLYSGAMLLASGMMYVRLVALLGLFDIQLLYRLGLPFATLAALALLVGALWMRIPDTANQKPGQGVDSRNPLELGAALLFGGLFVAMLWISHLALMHFGRAGLYSLAAVMGVTDVDPFILGLANSSTASISDATASGAIIIAAASNNLVKGAYAYANAGRQAGLQGLALLTVLALLGLCPLWL